MANLIITNPAITAQFTYEAEDFNHNGSYKLDDETKKVVELNAQVTEEGNYIGSINVYMVGNKRKLNITDVESENIAEVTTDASALLAAIEAKYE